MRRSLSFGSRYASLTSLESARPLSTRKSARRGSPLSAGFDLSSASRKGTYGRIAPRSGLAVKKFIDVGAGVVDADYRGPVGVVLFNFGEEDFVVEQGDRVAQLVLEKISMLCPLEVNELTNTDRGEKEALEALE